MSALLLGVLGSLIAAAIAGGVAYGWRYRKEHNALKMAQQRAALEPPEPQYPVRLTCREETVFDPSSGPREILHFEVFNHSRQPVSVKGFGLRITYREQAEWREYEQARSHPAPTFPLRLRANDGVEGYIDMEALADELDGRGYRQLVVDTAPYVEVIGYGEHNVETQRDARVD